ncbi:MAG: extracellular solute-binding protein, partial [Blautia coccoides]
MINLRLWHPWENEGEAYKKSFLEAVEEYNETHDRIQIQAEGTEMELYREKLPSAIASNDTPDIYFCFGDSYLRGAVSSGKLLKMNEFLSDDTG